MSAAARLLEFLAGKVIVRQGLVDQIQDALNFLAWLEEAEPGVLAILREAYERAKAGTPAGREVVGALGPDRQHAYISTACCHQQHASCRKTCKFCAAPCQCECHIGQVAR